MKLIFLLFAAAILVNIAAWIWIDLSVPAEIFPALLFYNIFWEQDVFGERSLLFSAPLLGALIILLNGGLAMLFRRSERGKFLLALLASSTFALQFIVLSIAWLVITINT